mmetsp:Transcript_83303/g.222735  ORF Transcript_83303/g.222735 Transcript_83303/m.222735 type:complete len:119 (+) Transcript_83303:1-357(+)
MASMDKGDLSHKDFVNQELDISGLGVVLEPESEPGATAASKVVEFHERPFGMVLEPAQFEDKRASTVVTSVRGLAAAATVGVGWVVSTINGVDMKSRSYHEVVKQLVAADLPCKVEFE